MSIEIPPIAEIRAALQPLTLKQLDALGTLSGVPAATIAKIRRGETKNPGTETCRKFLPHLDAARALPDQQQAAAA
jgi:predicted transcriptional regulator